MHADQVASLVDAIAALRLVVGIVGAAGCVTLVCCVFLLNTKRGRE